MSLRIASFCKLTALLLLLLDHIRADDLPHCDPSQSPYDPLACWLYKLQVELPDQSFHDYVTLSIKNVVCTEFTLSQLASSYVAAENHPGLFLNLTSLQASCTGTYRLTGGIGGHLRASVTNRDPVHATLELNSTVVGHIRQPTAVSTQDCHTDLVVSYLHFDGSISAHLIDLFQKRIRNYVSDELKTVLCPLLQEQLDPMLTTWLHKALDYIQPFLPHDPHTGTLHQQTETKESLSPLSRRMSVTSTQATTGSTTTTTTSALTASRSIADLPVLVESLQLVNQVLRLYLTQGPWADWWDDDSEDCGFDNGINGIIALFGQPCFSLDRFPIRFQNAIGAIGIHLHRVCVDGLDQFTNVTFFQPPYMETSVQAPAGINVSAQVHFVLDSVPGSIFQGNQTLQESFQLEFNTTHWQMLLRVAASIREDTTLQSLRHDPSCWLQHVALQNVSLSALVPRLVIQNMDKGTDQHALEHDLDELINNMVQLALEQYPVLVTAVLAGVVEGPLVGVLNRALERFFKTTSPCHQAASSSHQLANFSSLPFLQTMNDFLNRDNTLRFINQFVECTASSATQQLQGPLDDLQLDNLGSFGNIALLQPQLDGLHLQNGFDWGWSVTQEQDVPSIRLSGKFALNELQATVVVNATLFFHVDFHAGAYVEFDENQLWNMTLEDVLTHAQCVAVPTSVLRAYNISSDLQRLGLNLTATVLPNNATDDRNLLNLNFTSEEYPEIVATVSSAVGGIFGTIEDWGNAIASDLLVGSKDLCSGRMPANENDDSSDDGAGDEEQGQDLTSYLLVFVALLTLAQSILVVVSKQERVETSQVDATAGDDSLGEPLLIHDSMQQREEDRPQTSSSGDGICDNKPSSLMRSSFLPEFVRHSMPIVLVGTIVLLLASNLSTGASVDLTVSVSAERTITLPTLFAFSLGNTAREMWRAGIYPLFFLVVVFSGIWPYCKLLLMLYSWVSPKSWLSARRRERLLLAMDALGKFSLVDTYVLVLMVVAFRYHFEVSDDVALDVYVSPEFGFYGFLGATCLSLVAGHLCIFFHRLSEIHLQPASTEPQSFFTHEFDLSGGIRKRLSRKLQFLLVLCAVAAAVLLFFGVFKESFVFEFGGVAGDLIGNRRRQSYSLWTLGTSLPQSVKEPGVGIFCLQAVYCFFAIVTPFACVGILTILVLFPMRLGAQRIFLALAETTNAWSAVEVFVVSVIAALLEISTFASFIVGDRCDLINAIVSEYLDEDRACFTVETEILTNAWLLVFGTVLNSFVVSVALRLAHCVVNERIARESGAESDGCTGFLQTLGALKCGCFLIASNDDEPQYLRLDDEDSGVSEEASSEMVSAP